MKFVKLSCDVLCRTDLSAGCKLVYSVIRDRIGQNSEAWPSLQRLAEDCGLGRTTVSDAVDKLAEVGLLEVDRAGHNPKRESNRYWLPSIPKTEARSARRFGNRASDSSVSGHKPDQENKTRRADPKSGRA